MKQTCIIDQLVASFKKIFCFEADGHPHAKQTLVYHHIFISVTSLILRKETIQFGPVGKANDWKDF